MPEEILNPSDFHVGWSAQSLAGDIYVIVKATDKTVTFDKMARYFYAFRWAYGIGATWDDGSWPGELYVFESRAERDAWVADDVFDGNWHCEAITSKEARHIMADTVIGFDNDMAARYDGSRSAVERYAPTAELVRAWRRIDMQLNPVAYMGE